MYVFGEFYSLYQLVRDWKVRIGGSCYRIKALHDRLDCLITAKDNLSFIQRSDSESPNICVVIIFGLRRRNFF
jgi:hypothetical protein